MKRRWRGRRATPLGLGKDTALHTYRKALPLFPAFDLLTDAAGTEARRRYYRPYLDLAQKVRAGFVPDGRIWGTSAE